MKFSPILLFPVMLPSGGLCSVPLLLHPSFSSVSCITPGFLRILPYVFNGLSSSPLCYLCKCVSVLYDLIISMDCIFVNTISENFSCFFILSVFNNLLIEFCINKIKLIKFSDNLIVETNSKKSRRKCLSLSPGFYPHSIAVKSIETVPRQNRARHNALFVADRGKRAQFHRPSGREKSRHHADDYGKYQRRSRQPWGNIGQTGHIAARRHRLIDDG